MLGLPLSPFASGAMGRFYCTWRMHALAEHFFLSLRMQVRGYALQRQTVP
jgi:hypothetical protein